MKETRVAERVEEEVELGDRCSFLDENTHPARKEMDGEKVGSPRLLRDYFLFRRIERSEGEGCLY